MKKKLAILVPILVLGIGYEAYSKVTAPKPPKMKISGSIYVMPKDFTLNLAGGQYATLSVALELAATQAMATTDPSNPPPTGYGDLPEEPAVRAIITDDVTGQKASALINPGQRRALEAEILSNIDSQTDVKVIKVLFADLAVQ
jgi:flagellar protein FliL